jgi:two-component sensor histidine kinase
VHLDYHKTGQRILTVADNGVGLPGNFFDSDERQTSLSSLKGDGLGLQLVSTLARQPGGEGKVSSKSGTSFTVI